MTILYLWIIELPPVGIILKIKNKEFDDPKLFIGIII